MATIHDTTLVPGKLDLLSDWLPRQPWYQAHEGPPALVRSGGFRLDDPAGEVGVEFLFVTDTAGATTYAVPLAYRGAPLDDDDGALVGTSQHGVLGPRWFYDGARDPVAMTQLRELAAGRVVAAHQTRSDTADPTVTGSWSGPGEPAEVEVVRVLDPQEPAGGGAPPGEVTAVVTLPDGSRVRRRVAAVR